MSRFAAFTRHPRWAVDNDSPTDTPPGHTITMNAHGENLTCSTFWFWSGYILFLLLLVLVVYFVYPFRRLVWFVMRNRMSHSFAGVDWRRLLVRLVENVLEGFGFTLTRTSSTMVEGHTVSLGGVQELEGGMVALRTPEYGNDPSLVVLGEVPDAHSSSYVEV